MNLAQFQRRIRIVLRLLASVLILCIAMLIAFAFVKVDQTYDARGYIRPVHEISIYAPDTGFLKERLATEGDFVPKGGLLYRLEDWDLEKRRVDLESQRREINAELQLQETRLARVKDPAMAEVHAQTDVLRAKAASVESQMETLKKEIARREIRAPEASTITLVLARDPGQPVRQGQELMRLQTSKELAVYLYGGEHNIHMVHPGQKVRFETQVFSPMREGYCYAEIYKVAMDVPHPPIDGQEQKHPYWIGAKVTYAPIPLKLGASVKAQITLRRDSAVKVLLNLD